MQKKSFNPIRYVLIAAVILKIAALAVVIVAMPYLPRDFAWVILGILSATILVQLRLLLRKNKGREGNRDRGKTIPMQ